MKLSFYLFRGEGDNLDGLIRGKYLSGFDAYEEITPVESLPIQAKFYIKRSIKRTPKWLRFFEPHFAPSALQVESSFNGMLILLLVDSRRFAISFGQGVHALDRTLLQTDFGLKVGLNALNSKQVRMMDTRNVDLITRQRRTFLSKASPMTEFGLNFDLDWVRTISGTPNDQSFSKSISGADSCMLNCEVDVLGLEDKCRELLKLYADTRYKEEFGFLDQIRPLSKKDPVIVDLNQSVLRAFNSRSHDRLSVVQPDVVDYDQIEHYKAEYHGRKDDLTDISLASVYEYLEDNKIWGDSIGKQIDPHEVWLMGIGEDGQPVTKRRNLFDYLVAEVDLPVTPAGNKSETTKYMLSAGAWFRVEGDYAEQIRQQVSAITDLTDALALPPMGFEEEEEAYNKKVASAKTWVLMDQRLVHFRKAQKIEVCDLITPDGGFIAVKKMSSSATLSHLFSQCSVSAELLSSESKVKQFVVAAVSKASTSFDVNDKGSITFVYGISTDKDGPLSSSLFFFSQINLLQHARRIQTFGYKVAICRIALQPSASTV